MKSATVIGAGLVGSLWSVFLARRGYQVTVYESRADIRSDRGAAGRSINLIITAKGLNALRQVDLEKAVLDITVPVYGRMMHDLEGQTTYQPYGRDRSECNYSVSRSGLNKLMISLAEQAGVKFVFEKPVERIDLPGQKVFFESGESVDYQVLYGTDGAGSPVRRSLMSEVQGEDRTDWLGSDYKEMLMPATADGKYPIDSSSLHIWPRGDQFLMALPNLDGSFTMTLYMKSADFEKVRSKEDVTALFAEKYSDAVPLMPEFAEEFFENPTGRLGTVRCHPWCHKGDVALLGDAAHAIVPFFGQGMNSGFDDCYKLAQLLDQGDDTESIFQTYSDSQKKNGDAIADMAIDNYYEMQERVGDAKFLLRKAIEHRIEKELPTLYRSRYALVTYTLVDYERAQQIGEIQNRILDELSDGLETPEALDMAKARSVIERELSPFCSEHQIRF